jgi:hypothetical protein
VYLTSKTISRKLMDKVCFEVCNDRRGGGGGGVGGGRRIFSLSVFEMQMEVKINHSN